MSGQTEVLYPSKTLLGRIYSAPWVRDPREIAKRPIESGACAYPKEKQRG